MTIEFTFGDNSDKSSFFLKKKIMNLIDHDLTAHLITQTLTLVTTGRTTGADKGNPTVHSHATS